MLAVAKGRERVRAATRVQREACYRAISSRNETQVQPMESHPHQRRGRRGWKAVKPAAEPQDEVPDASLACNGTLLLINILADSLRSLQTITQNPVGTLGTCHYTGSLALLSFLLALGT